MTPDACVRARRLLGWKRITLAIKANLSCETVRSFELEHHLALPRTVSALRAVFEAANVEFNADERGNWVVRLKKAE